MENTDTEFCNCGKPLVKKENMMFLREVGGMPGMYCKDCNALYDSKEWKDALQNRANRIYRNT